MATAFLGMGLLGSNFVRALLKKGEQVQVWNRTTSKATDMEQYGAKAFENVADAVKGVNRVHLTLKDDASVDQVLEMARPGLASGTIIIDHTTTSKEGAIRRTKEWQAKGIVYQHAPVFMGPGNALDSTGYMLVSGDPAITAKLEPVLSQMTGKLLNFGPEPGKAAAMKLIGNAFLVCFTASVKDTLSLSKALEVPVADVLTLFNSWNPGAQIPARFQRVANGDYTNPSWELTMARKDTGLFIQAAEKTGSELTLIPTIAQLMDEWIAKGFGHSDWTVIAKRVADAK